MLEYDGRVGDERPEVVRLETGISLEVLEKSGLIGVVIWVCAAPLVSYLAL